MKKNYNYTRAKLFLPEYGRHIHEMVDSLLKITDRDERTRQAQAVIAVMGNLNSTLRDTEEFKHKLWDHLFIMSDFELDVDCPYPLPSRNDLTIKPERLHYPQSYISQKYYGKYLRKMIKEVAKHKDTEDIQPDLLGIFSFMRLKSLEYNKEIPNNDIISRDIEEMSEHSIKMDTTLMEEMNSATDSIQKPVRHSYQRSKINRVKPKHNKRTL